jgi:hypothetical protein
MCQNLMNIYSRNVSSSGGASRESIFSSTVTEILLKMKSSF